MRQPEAVRPARSRGGLPVPGHPSSDGNKSETGGLEPFECRYTTFLQTTWSRSFAAPPAKKRVPCANEDKLVDV